MPQREAIACGISTPTQSAGAPPVGTTPTANGKDFATPPPDITPTPGVGGGAATGTGNGTTTGQSNTTGSNPKDEKDAGMMGALIATAVGLLLVLVAGGIGGWNLYSKKRKGALGDPTPGPSTQGSWDQGVPAPAYSGAPYDQQYGAGWQADAAPVVAQVGFSGYNQSSDYNGSSNYNQSSSDYNGLNNSNAPSDYNGPNNYNQSSDYNAPSNDTPPLDYNGYPQAPQYPVYGVPMTPPLGSPVPPAAPPPAYRERDEYATTYVDESLQEHMPQAPMQSGDGYGTPLPPSTPEEGLTDPFLRAMMRQAQAGLFAIPDKESS